MEQAITKNIVTKNGANEFQLRWLKEEGVGLLTTKNEENYLILDSIDYWYDVIQNEYPKKKKCSCKNEWFYVTFDYILRQETDDVREIVITTTCTDCSKISKPIYIDIDYSPTEELIENPITFCEKPNIKYKYQQLTSYWSGKNINEFLQFIFQDLKLNVYCWFSEHPENKKRFEKVSFEKAIKIITVNHRYFNFYFSAQELDTSSSIYLQQFNDGEAHLKMGIWRRDEIIQLSAPFVIMGYGVLYYINFCNQYLDKGNVKDKSEQFEIITTQLKQWLKENFITKRGKNCFDGQEAYEKLMKRKNS